MKEGDGDNNIAQLKAEPFFRILNTLSIDVVIGSVFSTFFVAKLLSVDPNWAFWISFPISVWIIYTLDHLVDASRLKSAAHTYRHRFHYMHLKKLIFIIIVLSIIDSIIILMWLQKELIFFGLLLILLTIFYLLFLYFNTNTKIPLFKEIFVSTIYTLGIWGGPISISNFNINSSQILLLIIFLLLVLSDVLLLSYYEVESDRKDNHSTFTVIYGKPLTAQMITIILLIVFSSSIFIIYSHELFLYRVAVKIFLLMGMLEIVTLSFSHVLEKDKIYRYIIELVFWIPGLILLV